MKRIVALVGILAVLLTGCGKKPEVVWQEQYGLGVRYLSEDNYQEAIIAFTAAIEIDPKQAPAYVGRGDAYVLSGETEGNLLTAKADYEKAIELDDTNVDAYLGLADVYIRQGDYEKALEILKQGIEKTGQNQKIVDRLEKIEQKSIYNEYGATKFMHRSNYHAFESLPEDQQLLCIQMVESALICDYDAMRQIAKTAGYHGTEFTYTIWNEYKVRYHFSNNYYGITLRPENGMGYDVRVVLSSSDDSIVEHFWIASCPCVNWQWDGFYISKDTVDMIFKNPIYPWVSQHSETTVTGQYSNGLRHGKFFQENFSILNYKDAPAIEHEEKGTATYDMGNLVQFEGDVEIDISSEDNLDLGDQSVKDSLYW